MIKKISSKENLIIKRIKQLEYKKYREKYQQFLLEGVNLIEEGLKNNAEFHFVVYKDTFLNDSYNEELISCLLEKNILVYNVPDVLFEYIADTESPQGIISVVAKPQFDFQSILETSGTNLLVLDRIQDPGNMGTILRTADASGIDGVIVIKGSVDLYLSKTIRAAAGSIFRIPVTYMEDTTTVISTLKVHNKKIIATSPRAELYCYDIPLDKDTALIIGNEANGVSIEIIQSADNIVKIPMIRATESLNASVAASIIMYEMVRQKMKRH